MKNQKIIEGCVIYDTSGKCYMNNEYQYCTKSEFPCIYDNIENAKEIIEENDVPEDYEIHKVKIFLEIEETYKREIVYNLIENKTE